MRKETLRALLGIAGAVITAAAGAAVSAIVVNKLSRQPTGQPVDAPPPLIPIKLASSKNDVDLGGGWTMHDVSEYQSAVGEQKIAAGFTPGAKVVLVLSYHGAPPVPYLVTITNRLPDGYAGSWAVLAPPGGPQMIDFQAEHILV